MLGLLIKMLLRFEKLLKMESLYRSIAPPSLAILGFGSLLFVGTILTLSQELRCPCNHFIAL